MESIGKDRENNKHDISDEQLREMYDSEPSELELEIGVFIDSLIGIGDKERDSVAIHIVQDEEEFRDNLQATRAGGVMLGSDERIGGQYYEDMDIRKSSSQIVDLGLSVTRQEIDKRRVVSEDNIVWYPGERERVNTVSATFTYASPSGEMFRESIRLHSGEGSGVYAMGVSWVSNYDERKPSGRHFKEITDITDEDAHQFMKVVVEAIGDNPKTSDQIRQERYGQLVENFMRTGDIGVMEEYVAATWWGQALYDLTRRDERLDGNSIVDALGIPEHREQALSIMQRKIRRKQLHKELYGDDPLD